MKTPVAASIAVLATVLPASFARAEIQTRMAQHQPGDICQLSIPTTDTKVRPKATGFRNEGTTNAYVICSFPSAEGGYQAATEYVISFYSLDGVARSVSCTGVAGIYPGALDSIYLTKTTSVSFPLPNTNHIRYVLEDYHYTDTFPGSFSVTCVLPPQTAVNDAYTYSRVDVGP